MIETRKIKIAVCSPSFSKNPVLRNDLENAFHRTLFNDTGKHYSQNDLSRHLKDCNGIVGSLEEINNEALSKLPKLEAIAKFGVGIDNIDLNACENHEVKVFYTPGVNKKSVAEMVICFMIGLCRNIFFTSSLLKKGIWKKNGGKDLNSRTIGIIGVGNVGKELIRLLKPFGCKILVNDIIPQQEYYQTNSLIEVSKDEIYKKSDIITIHTPLTEVTEGMINSSVLSLMKKDCFLINSARGKIVRQKDLHAALKKEIISGAALDVFELEPPVDKDFLALPNLITTPHIGGNSFESVLSMGRTAIKHLEDSFYG